MWYIEDANGFSREELLDLYKIINQREKAFRDDLFRFTNFYAAVCYAILGITLSGFVSLYGQGKILLLLLFGPAVAFLMCVLGIRVTGRIYRKVLEEISVRAKIENLLGFDRPLPVQKYLGEKQMWEKENSFIPARHFDRRFKDSESSEFINASKGGGFYRDNRFFFGIIMIFSIMLFVMIGGICVYHVL